MSDLSRVMANIGYLVEKFYEIRLASGDVVFTAKELQDWIASRYERIAPDSPNRILRSLRQKGKINYTVLSRSNSEYQVLPLKEAA